MHRAVLKMIGASNHGILLTLVQRFFISCLHLSHKQLSTQREKESRQIASLWSKKICQKRFLSFQKQDKIKKERHAILNKMLLKSETKNNSELSDGVQLSDKDKSELNDSLRDQLSEKNSSRKTARMLNSQTRMNSVFLY